MKPRKLTQEKVDAINRRRMMRGGGCASEDVTRTTEYGPMKETLVELDERGRGRLAPAWKITVFATLTALAACTPSSVAPAPVAPPPPGDICIVINSTGQITCDSDPDFYDVAAGIAARKAKR